MPTTGRRPRKNAAAKEQVDVLDDLEIVPETPRSTKKDVPVSELISNTLTDRLSATASYAVSNNMLQTVGREYAISPLEAYNIIHPTANIIVHYLPTTTIKTKLPSDVADNVEKVIVTALEYFSRVLALFVHNQFNKNLAKNGLEMRPADQPKAIHNGATPKAPNAPIQSPVMSPEEIEELVGSNGMPIDDDDMTLQVRPGRTGANLSELVEDGIITGDLGQVM